MRARHLAVLALALGACAPRPRPGGAAGPAALPPTVTNGLGMEFVLIPPGSVVVGRFHTLCPVAGPDGMPVFPAPSDTGSARRAAAPLPEGATGTPAWTARDAALCAELSRRDERPGFRVTLDRPFYLGRYEVTQAEWTRVMGYNPSVFQGSRAPGDSDRRPVDSVSWEAAQEFVRRLNELDPTARYRLPTEFEWEYAAHGGSPDEPTWAAASAQAAAGSESTFPVGTRAPNAYGLYDVFGNVWEWVQDPYNDALFPDPTPPRSGGVHVLKGASFVGDVKNFTPATHAAGPANGWDVGFRVLREAGGG